MNDFEADFEAFLKCANIFVQIMAVQNDMVVYIYMRGCILGEFLQSTKAACCLLHGSAIP